MSLQSAPSMPSTAAFTSREFRSALGMFATGVTIVTTTAADGTPVGLTVSSFNSVSLEPPLVLWSLAHSASSMAVFQACTHYAVHVLGDDQGELAHRFATRGIDRFAQTPTRPGPTGVPLLLGCIAHFECRNRSQHQEGDHVVFVGEVLHCTRTASARPPLLYQAGQLHMGGRLHVGS